MGFTLFVSFWLFYVVFGFFMGFLHTVYDEFSGPGLTRVHAKTGGALCHIARSAACPELAGLVDPGNGVAVHVAAPSRRTGRSLLAEAGHGASVALAHVGSRGGQGFFDLRGGL